MITGSDLKFGKKYKLCSKKAIDLIFEKGSTVKEFPFVLRFVEFENEEKVPFQMVISAPKKIFKSAVKRNRIKRICREAVRLNKDELESYCLANKKQLALFLIYTDQSELKAEILNRKIRKVFKKLIEKI
jgi:ribonuclease P protein component